MSGFVLTIDPRLRVLFCSCKNLMVHHGFSVSLEGEFFVAIDIFMHVEKKSFGVLTISKNGSII